MNNAASSAKMNSTHSNGLIWVTVSEAARHYRVSRNTIYEACREGELKHTRIRTTLRILINDHETYLTVAEVARAMKVNPSTVYEACALTAGPGLIENIRIRSRIRIPASSITSHITSKEAR